MSTYRVGVSYYPEWWPEEEWEQDFSKMEALGINLVRMGEFAWSWFEPSEGQYQFEPMRRVLDLAARHGISVILGTVSAICPPWLYKKFPEVKGGDLHGDYTFGGRKGNCLSSPELREYVRRITEEQARALGGHPAVIGWQLDNEPGYPFAEYDKRCVKKFRRWLRDRYGTIDELNREWFTMFWSNRYTSFDEIDFPTHSAEGAWHPALFLATRRFFSDNFNSLLSMEAEILRRHVGPDVFLYTNWPGANWSVNCFDGTKYLDYAAWDNYVTLPTGEDYRLQLRSSMEHDFDRRLSCGKQRFLVAEQTVAPNAQTLPEAIAAQSWLDVAQGAFGTIFFEWRPPLGGAEQSYFSLLAGDLTYGEGAPAVRRFAADVQKVWPMLESSRTEADIATLYSYESSWSTRGWTVDGPYDQDFFNLHGALRNALRRDLDVVGIQDDLTPYRMIAAPGFRICTEEQAAKLDAWVRGGGILILSRDCGMFDPECLMYTRRVPGLFREMCGVAAVSSISSDQMASLSGGFTGVEFPDGRRFASWKMLYKLRLEADDVEVLATYTCGKLAGTPAVTLHPWGKGWAVYLAADCDDYRYYEALARELGRRFGFAPLFEAEDGVLAARRVTDEGDVLFAVNMTETPKRVTLPRRMTDLVSGEPAGPEVTLPGFGTLVAR